MRQSNGLYRRIDPRQAVYPKNLYSNPCPWLGCRE